MSKHPAALTPETEVVMRSWILLWVPADQQADALKDLDAALADARAAARKEVLTPAEIRDLDMALRYSRIDHDYSCPAISPMALGDCTCGAAEYRERARLVTHRIGAPYRARSGDYLLDSLSTDTREEHGDAD